MNNQPLQLHITNCLFPYSTCREARNRAEKQRRDKLNSSVNELSTMVPHVVDSPKKVDKTAVLRFAAHGLRVDYGTFSFIQTSMVIYKIHFYSFSKSEKTCDH